MASRGVRGVKRKRGSDDTMDGIQTKLAGKLHHGFRESKHAAKKAKTFETQKLVKKLKGLKPDADRKERSQLEHLLNAIKSADHDRFGNFALFNKLRKDKVLSRNEQFQAVMEAEISTPAPTSSGLAPELEARLLSSKALSSEVNAIISSLRTLLLPPSERPSSGSTDGSPERPSKAPKSGNGKNEIGKKLGSGGAEDDGSSSGSDEDDEDEDEDEDEDDGKGLTLPSTRIPETIDDGWESGTVHSEDHDSYGDESNESGDDAPKPSAKAPKATSRTPASKQLDASESLFLPSLAVGFTRGDSDSEFDDKEAAAADGVRKNRRGQRARRAIWEKKFGKGAKHLQYANEQRSIKQEVRSGRPGPHGKPQQTGRNPNQSKPNFTRAPLGTPAVPRTWTAAPPQPSVSPRRPPRKDISRDEQPLHPSWEAKKRLKEQQSASIRPGQGTRITFDD